MRVLALDDQGRDVDVTANDPMRGREKPPRDWRLADLVGQAARSRFVGTKVRRFTRLLDAYAKEWQRWH